jgi:hypothetical protein
MHIARNRLYIILIVSCLAGYIWLAFSQISAHYHNNEVSLCFIKHVTGIPCPSCGSTRSVLSLLQGNLYESLYWNPIGILLIVIMVSVPLWILYDTLRKKDSLFRFYLNTEEFFRKRQVALVAIVLVLSNWIWNIHKGL